MRSHDRHEREFQAAIHQVRLEGATHGGRMTGPRLSAMERAKQRRRGGH